MASTASEEEPMKSNEKIYDDLTAITGIGPARQRWLREAFGIRTYQDLAALSANQIESQLKADRQIASRSAIEAWPIQAREFATSAGRSSTPALESADERFTKEANSLTREDGWKDLAQFVVVFQTREVEGQVEERRTAVHHMEKDTGTHWPGIESKKLCYWILDQIRDQVELKPEEYDLTQPQPAEAPSAAKSHAEVKITQIRVFQPPQSETPTQSIEPGKPFYGSVKGSSPFTLEVAFELAGPAAADIAREQVECNAQSYVYDQAKATSILLGDTGPNTFEEEKFAYTFTLPEATLQQANYRLWVLVTPQAGLAVPDFLEVPTFEVV
jgi:hypothetical protein